MKVKLFSLKSVLISAKAIVSGIITGISAVVFWGLSYYFMRTQMYVLGGIFSVITFIWYLFFFGWISSKLWKWK